MKYTTLSVINWSHRQIFAGNVSSFAKNGSVYHFFVTTRIDFCMSMGKRLFVGDVISNPISHNTRNGSPFRVHRVIYLNKVTSGKIFFLFPPRNLPS